jgi:hypothetical protein
MSCFYLSSRGRFLFVILVTVCLFSVGISAVDVCSTRNIPGPSGSHSINKALLRLFFVSQIYPLAESAMTRT